MGTVLRSVVIAAAVPAFLACLRDVAFAASVAASVVTVDADVRAILGTVLAGIAAGILLAIVSLER